MSAVRGRLNMRTVMANNVAEFLSKVRTGGHRAAEAVVQAIEPRPIETTWGRAQLGGRMVEVSAMGAAAALTAAVGLVLEAQVEGEPVAWIALPGSCFYPPDLADSGVDLEALVVVRAPAVPAAGRAADRLLRSGAFGLVVLDLGRDAQLPIPLQGRLVGLAQRHDAALLCLTEKPADAASLGSMVSLRAEASRLRRSDSGFSYAVRALKDKRRGPGWSHDEPARGPAGL